MLLSLQKEFSSVLVLYVLLKGSPPLECPSPHSHMLRSIGLREFPPNGVFFAEARSVPFNG